MFLAIGARVEAAWCAVMRFVGTRVLSGSCGRSTVTRRGVTPALKTCRLGRWWVSVGARADPAPIGPDSGLGRDHHVEGGLGNLLGVGEPAVGKSPQCAPQPGLVAQGGPALRHRVWHAQVVA